MTREEKSDLLQVAGIIADASVVVCNQTSARAIAEGLRHPRVIMERWPDVPNVDFVREGVTNHY